MAKTLREVVKNKGEWNESSHYEIYIVGHNKTDKMIFSTSKAYCGNIAGGVSINFGDGAIVLNSDDIIAMAKVLKEDRKNFPYN